MGIVVETCEIVDIYIYIYMFGILLQRIVCQFNNDDDYADMPPNTSNDVGLKRHETFTSQDAYDCVPKLYCK